MFSIINWLDKNIKSCSEARDVSKKNSLGAVMLAGKVKGFVNVKNFIVDKHFNTKEIDIDYYAILEGKDKEL